MTARQPKALLWDMDGTLVDSEPLHERALIHTLEARRIAPPPGLNALLVGAPGAVVYAHIVERLGYDRSEAEWTAAYFRFYLAHAGELRPREGARAAFAAAERRGWRQAVVSNSDRVLVGATLGGAGFARLGAVSVARNDVRRGKPDPEPYARALHLIGAEAREATAIEDSAIGAAAALAAGLRTLYWPQDETAAPAGAEHIDSPAALFAQLGLAP